jgi:hypothetical protein
MPCNASYARFIFGKFFTSTIILYVLLLAQKVFFLQKVGVTLTSMVCFMIVMGSWCLTTNDDDIKECDAPESNKTVAGCELARNIPNTTS